MLVETRRIDLADYSANPIEPEPNAAEPTHGSEHATGTRHDKVGGSGVIMPGGEDTHRGRVEAERFDSDLLEASL